MGEIIKFVARRDLSARENLNNFILLARDNLTIWSNLSGFHWEQNSWPTTHKPIRFTNFENTPAPRNTLLLPHQLMEPNFIDTAKSYLRYKQSFKKTKTIRIEAKALRVIEYALRQEMFTPDITKFEERHWHIATKIVEPFASRQAICSCMLSIIKTFSDFFIIQSDPRGWKNPYVGLDSYDFQNGARAPDEVKSKKVPKQDALLAIAEIFSQGNSTTQEDADIMITCTTGILLSAPMRISETLRLRVDSLREDTDKLGGQQNYLAYWVPKYKDFARKAIPATMAGVINDESPRIS
jgi:hypothetical protein